MSNGFDRGAGNGHGFDHSAGNSHRFDHGVGNGNLYGFPNEIRRDRHIQNIIDHTENMFSENTYNWSQFSPAGIPDVSAHDTPSYTSPFVEQPANDDNQLDDFDRSLLGIPSTSNYHPISNRLGADSPRISLPHSDMSAIRQPRVVGDASHHFRPFMPRNDDYQPQFASNPLQMDQLQPSPAAQSIFMRDGSQRVAALQPGSQLVTPPFYSAQHNLPAPSHMSQSSSSELGSSPSTRLTLKRQEPRKASLFNPISNDLALDLSHAPIDLTPKVNGIHLVDPRKVLSDKCRAVFPYEIFNAVQSKCFPLVYHSNDNIVISAPTGSGKTAILEMAICKLVSTPGGETYKIVYQAPTKSLCSERAKDWDKKFSHLGLKCVELTGDTSKAEARRVGQASIIVTTPEKWDSITRKWADHRKLLQMVRLFLIDEVHMLKDTRGATLEAVVSRMKTIGAEVRFVALSATVPNIQDIAAWLGRNHSNPKEAARSQTFAESLRPVKLKRYVYGYDSPGNDFVFDKVLDGKLAVLLGKHSEKKPVMVFCITRDSCERTARTLAEWWAASSPQDKAWPAPTKRIPVIGKVLQELVRYGVAFHHAGLDLQDRVAVEQQFLQGQIHLICCTSTLAVGVNLPCHTVVLKGTTGWTDNGRQEYSDLEVMQMLGRAGRPQFDKSAVAIIMTKRDSVDKYEKLLDGNEVLESTLHHNLLEHLNSEIGLGTIKNLETAKTWMNGTFLHVRMRQNPKHYDHDSSSANPVSTRNADMRIEEWCDRDISLLRQHRLISQDETFTCTEYGKIMSRYMVKFDTMKLILSIPRAPSLEQMLTTLSKAEEFKEMRLKPGERQVFRTLNNLVRFRIDEINTPETWHKISLIVQVHLGMVEIPTNEESKAPPGKQKETVVKSITFEKTKIFDRMSSLVRCVIDCKVFDDDAAGARVGLELARAIAAGSWESHPAQLRQIGGIGPVLTRKLISGEVRSILGLAALDAGQIERILGKDKPYGMNLLKKLTSFPRLRMTTEIVGGPESHSKTENTISITVRANLTYLNNEPPSWQGILPTVTFVAETTSGNLACFWRQNIESIKRSTGLNVEFTVGLSQPNECITCHYSCEKIVGTEVVQQLHPNVHPAAFEGLKKANNQTSQVKACPDDLDDEDVDDEDMLQVVDLVDQSIPKDRQFEPPSSMEDVEEEFPDIREIMDGPQSTTSSQEPSKMANGRWMCYHACRDGGLTKSGKQCIHKCCKDGLDKPRPPPRRKKATGGDSSQAGGDPIPSSQVAQPKHHTGQSSGSKKHTPAAEMQNGKSKISQRFASSNLNSANTSIKRPMSQETAASTSFKKARHNTNTVDVFMDDDIDMIDISHLTDSEDEKPVKPSKPKSVSSSLMKYGRSLSELHEKVQPHNITPARITKPFTARDTMSEYYMPSSTKTLFENPLMVNDDNESNYGSDVFADDDDLPELAEIFGKADRCQSQLVNDETLCPGVIETYNESKECDMRVPSQLSFTTINELERASQRQEMLSPKPGTVQMHDEKDSEDGQPFPWSPAGMDNEDIFDLDHVEASAGEVDGSMFPSDPVQKADDDPDQSSEHNYPAWVYDFDPEFIKEFSGVVQFEDN